MNEDTSLNFHAGLDLERESSKEGAIIVDWM